MRAAWQRFHDDRVADLQWLADNGDGAASAASRLGLTFKGLEEWCRRHDRAVWHQLRDNERRHTGGCRLSVSRLESAS